MKFLRKYVNGDIPGNLSSRLRRKRSLLFLNYINSIEIKNPKIIDIGGYHNYWLQLNSYFNSNLSPVLLNISKGWIMDNKFTSIVADGKDLACIKDKSFDVAFSNSVIEHISNFEDQQEMINNIKRISKYYFIQTPAFVFPIEPHFLFPFFHRLPVKVRIWLVRHFDLGWFRETKCYDEAKKLVKSIRIMKKKELKLLVKTAIIITEKIFHLSKSYMLTNLKIWKKS